MHMYYASYDSLYENAKANGWLGWGGESRVTSDALQMERLAQRRYVPLSGRALELGCGEGHFCRALSRRGYAVTGIDVSTVAIAWAREKQSTDCQIKYVCGNLCDPEILNGEAFELIVDGYCLHCILQSDRPAFLRNARRLLSDQGVLVIRSLCSKSECSSVTFLPDRGYRYISSVAELIRELERAELQTLDFEVSERTDYDRICLFAMRAST